MTSSFVQFFENVILFLLIRDYQHTKFGLIWVKESRVTEGGRSLPPPQVENVLNCPGEMGLMSAKFCWELLKVGVLVKPSCLVYYFATWPHGVLLL